MLAEDYTSLASRLELREREASDQDEIIAAVRRWLQQHPNWLLIFDNVSKPADVEAYLPDGPGHVLITSRNPDWAGIARPFKISVLRRAEATKFLLQRTGEPDEAGAAKVADELGDLPLALEQGGAYIARKRVSFSTYLDRLTRQRAKLWAREQPPRDHPAAVATTWSLVLDELRDRTRAAADVLALCAYLAPKSAFDNTRRNYDGYV